MRSFLTNWLMIISNGKSFQHGDEICGTITVENLLTG